MANQSDKTHLERFRDILIAKRSAILEGALSTHRRVRDEIAQPGRAPATPDELASAGWEDGEKFRKAQEEIEAVVRAIDDEKKIT